MYADGISLIVMGYSGRYLHTLVNLAAYSFAVCRARFVPSYNEHLFRQRVSADNWGNRGLYVDTRRTSADRRRRAQADRRRAVSSGRPRETAGGPARVPPAVRWPSVD